MTEKIIKEMDFRKSPPSAGPMPMIQIGDFDTIVLDNGLTLIVVENRKLPKVAFQLVVNHDPVIEGRLAGLSEIAGELLSRGTTSKSKSDIDDIVDFYGANLQTNGSGIFGSILSKYLNEYLSIFVDILLNPSFPESEFKKIKLRHMSRLQTTHNEPSEIAYNISTAANFGNQHPYGDILTAESLAQITLEDCKEYHAQYWKPSCSYLAVVGDICVDEVREVLAPRFNEWNPTGVPNHSYPKAIAPEQITICYFDRPGAIQSEVRLTYPVDLHPSNPDRIPAAIMNHILGGGAFSGYLMSNLREDKGFTYGVRSILHLDPLDAEFKVTTSVGTEVTVAAIREILFEMNRINNEKVDAEHLILAKNSMIGSFARSIESPQTLANRVLNIMRYNLPADFYETFTQKIESISAEDVQAMAQKYVFPDYVNIVIVGDLQAMKQDLHNLFPNGKLVMFDAFGKLIED